MIVGSEEAVLRELKELAPDLYNGVKERLLVKTTIVSYDRYKEHVKECGLLHDHNEETQKAIDEVTDALKVIQKFYQDNPPTLKTP